MTFWPSSSNSAWNRSPSVTDRVSASALQLPLTVIEADAEGEVARYEASLVLVRPDHFVAWSSREPQIAANQAADILALASGITQRRQ